MSDILRTLGETNGIISLNGSFRVRGEKQTTSSCTEGLISNQWQHPAGQTLLLLENRVVAMFYL